MRDTANTLPACERDPAAVRPGTLITGRFTRAENRQRHTRNLYAQIIVSLSGLLLIATGVHAADRLELEGTTITGSQELPKALHIVPWKPAEAGELAARPMNSLVDEILAPIDRDVFLRELEYYEAVHSSK